MKIFNLSIIATLLFGIVDVLAQSQDGVSQIIPVEPFNAQDSLRIEEISKMLPKKSGLYAVPISNRKVWDKIAANPNFANAIKDAEPYLESGFPEWSDSLYSEFFISGKRTNGEIMLEAREDCINILILAECLENKGRFLPLIEYGLVDIAKQNSWVYPAHDYGQGNFLGRRCSVDLAASTNGANYAIAYVTLKEKFSKESCEIIYESLMRHILNPIRYTMVSGKGHVWLRETTNWNAVCLSGVTTAALALLDDRYERAAYVHLAEKYSQNSIVGYPQDGYCTEGLGYYNFGFANYISLREVLYQATDGEIDLFKDEKIRNIAQFPVNIEIVNGVCPYYADCRWGVTVSPHLVNYCSRNLGLGLEEYDNLEFDIFSIDFAKTCMNTMPNSVSKSKPAEGGSSFKLRHYFDKSIVLVTRYAADSECKIAASIKGGHNNEHHNHNDVGSYTVVVGDEILMGDMGGPFEYTDKTFTDKRYVLYKILSSFGHPVPLISGNEQRAGRQHEAKLVYKNFTDLKDEFVIDIASAYSKDARISKLERHCELSREGKGYFVLRDEFTQDVVQPIETAITTRSKYEISPDQKSITLIGERESVKIEITASAPYDINICEITSGPFPYTRIGIQTKTVTEGSIELKYIPL
ncbi:MAG: hypothetical protein SNH73_00895 [Rikenellaceae bacterium]